MRAGGEGALSRLRLDAIPVAVAASGGLVWTATLPIPPPAPPAGKGGELRIAISSDSLDTDLPRRSPRTSLSCSI